MRSLFKTSQVVEKFLLCYFISDQEDIVYALKKVVRSKLAKTRLSSYQVKLIANKSQAILFTRNFGG